MIKKIVHSLLLVGLLNGAILPAFVHAQAAPAPFKDGFKTVDDIGKASGIKKNIFNDPKTLLTDATKKILTLVGIAALVALIVGGALYIFSFGDEKKMARAKTIILVTLLGLLVILLSALLVNLLITLFSAAPP